MRGHSRVELYARTTISLATKEKPADLDPRSLSSPIIPTSVVGGTIVAALSARSQKPFVCFCLPFSARASTRQALTVGGVNISTERNGFRRYSNGSQCGSRANERQDSRLLAIYLKGHDTLLVGDPFAAGRALSHSARSVRLHYKTIDRRQVGQRFVSPAERTAGLHERDKYRLSGIGRTPK